MALTECCHDEKIYLFLILILKAVFFYFFQVCLWGQNLVSFFKANLHFVLLFFHQEGVVYLWILVLEF